MCDYSLHHVASRPAKTGEKLVSTKFNGSSTRGFTAVGEPDVAVCVLPGTELGFQARVEYESGFHFFKPRHRLAGTVARFRRVNVEQPQMHHDALEFPDGQVVLLTQLRPGQTATVLQLPACQTPAEHEPTQQDQSLLTA